MADDAKLAEARKRVSRAERKALDKAIALRNEAVGLLEAAKAQAARIREAAKAEAARSEVTRVEAAAAAPEPGPTAEDLAAALADGDAARTELEAVAAARAKAEQAAKDAQAALAKANRESKAEIERLKGELEAATERLAAATAAPGDDAADPQPEAGPAAEVEVVVDEDGAGATTVGSEDVLALVALVESVEAERDALAARVEELEKRLATSGSDAKQTS